MNRARLCQPALKKAPLRLSAGAGERLQVVPRGNLGGAELGVQLGHHRRQQVVVGERRFGFERTQLGERDGGPFDARQCDGAVQADDWRGVDGEQIVVEGQDAIPAGVFRALRFGMHRRDRCLDVIAAHAPALGAALEVSEAKGDELSIPQPPILILQEHDLAVAVETSR